MVQTATAADCTVQDLQICRSRGGLCLRAVPNFAGRCAQGGHSALLPLCLTTPMCCWDVGWQSQYGLEVARTRVEAMAHSKHSPQVKW